MIETTSLDFLLLADTENATKSKEALASVEPKALDTVEATTSAFERLGELWGLRCGYDDHRRAMEECLGQLGLTDGDALKTLRDAVVIGPTDAADPATIAQHEMQRATAVVARSYLTTRLSRDFVFGLTDILRLRLSPALGSVRVQCETAALLRMMACDPKVAVDWLAATTKGLGRDFHDKWNSRVVEAIRDLDLYGGYQTGSEIGVHSRPWGITRGILVGRKSAPPGQIRLIYQECDDPRLLFLAFARYLGFHHRIISKVRDLYPELGEADASRITPPDCNELHASIARRAEEIRRNLGLAGLTRLYLGER